MGDQVGRVKSPWENRFRRPRAEELTVGFADKHVLQLFGAAREMLGSRPGVTEHVDWLGLPWRWTFVYGAADRNGDLTPAMAYLIPDPQKPQLSLPLTVEVVDALPLRRLKRFIRDAIVYGRFVAGVYWPIWELTSRAQLDEIADLVARKGKLAAAERESVAPLA